MIGHRYLYYSIFILFQILTFSRKAKDFDKEMPTIDITQGLKIASSLKSIHLSGNFEIDDSFQFHESLEELDIDFVDDFHYFSPLNYENLLQKCVNLRRLCVYGFFPLMVVFHNTFPKLEHFEWNKKDGNFNCDSISRERKRYKVVIVYHLLIIFFYIRFS